MSKRKIVGLIIISIGIFIPIASKYELYKKSYIESIEIKKYINNNQKSPFLLLIEIPKIKLYKGIYNQNSSENDISKNIKILEYSKLNNNTIILASHSGTADNAYFNDLSKLNLNDNINIYYNHKKLIYLVDNIKAIDKTGNLQLEDNLNNKLILITCSLTDENKQLIITSSLKKTITL